MIKGRDKLYVVLLSTVDGMLSAPVKDGGIKLEEGKAALISIKNILTTNKELFTKELEGSISTAQTDILMEIESCLLMILSVVINYPKYTTLTTDVLYQWMQTLVCGEVSEFATSPMTKEHLH